MEGAVDEARPRSHDRPLLYPLQRPLPDFSWLQVMGLFHAYRLWAFLGLQVMSGERHSRKARSHDQPLFDPLQRPLPVIGEVSQGEKMLYSGTDPESYITENTFVYEEKIFFTSTCTLVT